jgi:uncharacterized protein with HEPN domain
LPPEARVLIQDALEAAERIASFLVGKSLDDYLENAMLRSAVERQSEIVGEALHRLYRRQPDWAARVTDLSRAVSFRNVLIHGYATIDDPTVWQVATVHMPVLCEELRRLLEEYRS